MPFDIKDFKLPEQLDDYYQAMKEFVRTDLEAITQEMDETDRTPPRLLPMLRQAGLLTLMLPKKYGGSGLTMSQYWPIESESAKSCMGIRVYLHNFNNCWRFILTYASEEWKKKFLPIFFEGNNTFAFCLTEPNAGTGRDIKTTAVRVGHKYRINGIKHLITHPHTAEYFFVVCYTGDRSLGAAGTSMLIVPKGAPGFRIEYHPEIMGLRGSPHGILHFENCEIPVENIMGKEGQGLEIFMGPYWLDPDRLTVACSALGAAEKLLECSIEFVQKRVTFGKAIAERQSIQQMLAEMAMEIYVTKVAIADCARKYDEGKNITRDGSLLKGFAVEMATHVSDRALLIHGGIGLSKVFPVARLYKDIRAMWFEEGTPTIQKLVIARDLLGQPLRDIDRKKK